GDDDVHALVGECPLQQRLRPRRDTKRGELLAPRRAAKEGAPAERPHHDHRHTELGREWKEFALALPLARIQRQLHRVEASGPQRPCELAESARRIVRHTETADAARRALPVEPLQMLLPRYEVVHLLDIDAPVPLELLPELLAPLADTRRPDLRRHRRTFTG